MERITYNKGKCEKRSINLLTIACSRTWTPLRVLHVQLHAWRHVDNYRRAKIQFLLLIAIFALSYFGVCLPIFQAISKKRKGRKFIIRLGTPWKLSDPDHRWDVAMSFLSFVMALAISLYLFDLVVPFDTGA
jgi:hypothetical protein